MKILIIKTGAAGDVLRTTPLLRAFPGASFDWYVGRESQELLDNSRISKVIVDPIDFEGMSRYDTILSLEDDPVVCQSVFPLVSFDRVFGAYPGKNGHLIYSEDSAQWFDMGIISRYGLTRADKIKLKNRRSYQEIIFEGLGIPFRDHEYVMPHGVSRSALSGDIAVAPKAGARWRNKNWYGFDELVDKLARSYRVNLLPHRETLKEHIADVRGHKFLISNDSLPMHVALGLGIPCVAFFMCTSPWEIYDYGILRKIISPYLEDYFYRREYQARAVRGVTTEEAYQQVSEWLEKAPFPGSTY